MKEALIRNEEAVGVIPLTQRYTDQDILDVIQKMYGNIQLAALKLGVPYQQLSGWISSNEDRKQFVMESRKMMAEYSEGKLLQLLDSKNERIQFDTVKYILSHIGKGRGWGSSDPRVALQVNSDPESRRTQVNLIFGIDNDEAD